MAIGIVGFLGSALYAVAGVTGSVWTSIIARLVQGLSTGSNLLYRYYSVAVGEQRLSEVMSWNMMASTVGFAGKITLESPTISTTFIPSLSYFLKMRMLCCSFVRTDP